MFRHYFSWVWKKKNFLWVGYMFGTLLNEFMEIKVVFFFFFCLFLLIGIFLDEFIGMGDFF